MAGLLLVEDAEDVALIVQRLGRRSGYEVAVCADVAAAWQRLQGERPDLLLLDLNLPGPRGEELCRRVRAAPALSGLPVALFATWDRPDDIAAGLEAGADYVVSKDLLCDPDAWAARLRDLPPAPGRPGPPPLEWATADLLPAPPLAGVEALNRVLRHPLARQFGPEVLRIVLRRALRRVSGAGEAANWLEPDGLSLDAGQVAQVGGPDAVAGLARALAEQIWCLLGTVAGAPLLEALASAVIRPGG
jgi:twitching motility two-component system response regulator PilH